MRRIFALLITIIMIFGLTACGGGSSTESAEDNAAEPAAESSSEEAAEDTADNTQNASDILVVYFSATGTTKGVAEKIARSQAQTSMRSRQLRSTPVLILTGMIQTAVLLMLLFWAFIGMQCSLLCLRSGSRKDQ